MVLKNQLLAFKLHKLAFEFVGNSVSGQLNLDRCEFWLLTSQLLVLDVCLSDAFA
ncbi:DUF645 family protein [Vibrio cholerae]|nr:DUF645 family protein [Vibrio cholerae]EKF9607599.1 DUF645 family protein [Vibrio cholerae]HDZ3719774.1 DUF645 family protein [Vibrio cholerae]